MEEQLQEAWETLEEMHQVLEMQLEGNQRDASGQMQ